MFKNSEKGKKRDAVKSRRKKENPEKDDIETRRKNSQNNKEGNERI